MERAAGLIALAFFAAVVLFGCWLGFRNLRMGRGDRRGAMRLAVYWFVATFLAAAFSGHHVPALSEVGKILETISFTLLGAATVWALYIALEPYVRRYWPDVLISWSRLLAGRFRDPLVGRDLVVGAVAGVVFEVLIRLGQRVPAWVGSEPSTPTIGDLACLLGLRGTIGHVFGMLGSSLLTPIIFLFVLLLFRVLLRRDWAALLVFLGILAAIALSTHQRALVSVPFAILGLGIILGVIMRFGLLASIMTMLVGQMIGSAPITFQLSTWYAGWNLVPVVGLFVLLVYAAYISFAGRPIIGKNVFGGA